MYQRLEKKQERSSTEKENYHSPIKQYEYANDEIDASNPPPLIIRVAFDSDRKEGFYFRLSFQEPHYEYNEVARNCVIAPLSPINIFISEELKLPNSILMEAYDKLKNKFKNAQYIQFNGGESARITKETFFSREKSENKGYKVQSRFAEGKISDILNTEKAELLTQNYRTYKISQPLPLDYKNLCQRIYDETVHNYNRSDYIESKSKELMLAKKFSPTNFSMELSLRFSSQLGLYLRDTFYSILGPDEDDILEVLLKVDGHPPSIEKLKETFLLHHGVALDDFIHKHIPSYRKDWSRLLPNLQAEPLPLDYETMASTICNYYEVYLDEKEKIKVKNEAYFPFAGMYPTTQTKATPNKNRPAILSELIKLKRNRASIEQLEAHIDAFGFSLGEILQEMGLYNELSEYLYAPIQWKDQIRVENKEYSKEEIIRREKENNEISKPKRKTAKGYLVQFDNDGAYGYMVFKGDTIDGIKERFGVKQSDLENVNYWHEVHENGQYEDSVGIFWLQEGDIVYLPEYYTPKNGTLFYSYDRNTNTGIKVKKEQGKYEKNFLGENLTYKYFKDRLKEFADQFDDNTRTYSFDLSGSISISAQLSVFFYLGLDGKFGASIASGNTRSLGVNSYWSIGGNAGFGNKSVANIGVSGEYKQSLGMLEALNGSYTSIKHFMAFLDLNMYSFMLQNEWTVPLYKMGIDDEYWNHVMSEEGDVYHELSKGYVRAVNTSYVGQIEGGLKGVGGFNVGHQSVSVENYSVPQIISFDEVKAYSKIKSNDQLKKYNKEDVSNKIYATLKVGDGAECKFSYDTVESSLNSNNLGEYFNISLTINEYDISTNTNGEKDSNGVKTVYNFFNDVMTKYKSENSETVLDWTKQFEKNSTELKDEVKWNNRSIAHEEAKEEKRVAERKLEKQQTQQ
ncbi:hypothetical protein, partial [Flammeovirga sp. SJP92]|uniref:hypothetical protein n=1 Tax=Flammeovirga sp. SJP92 TaxID=1775430 RepID=UPI00079600E0